MRNLLAALLVSAVGCSTSSSIVDTDTLGQGTTGTSGGATRGTTGGTSGGSTTGSSGTGGTTSQQTADANRPSTGPTVRYMGRFDQSNPNAVTFSWSGSTIITRFQGTSLNIQLTEDENATYAGAPVDNFYDVFIDGALSGTFQAVHGIDTYRLTPEGLAEGDHYVWVVRRTEAQIGRATFYGFTPNAGGSLLPAPLPHSRRIEFIGDSITCGYGDLADANYLNMCSFSPQTEGADYTYAWLTSRALEAESVQVSFSGKGVAQNVDPVDDPYYTMPVLYGYTNADQHDVLWDFNSWTPDVVVIVLGGNDYAGLNSNDSNIPVPSDANFVAAYVGLIKEVRSHYANAHIVCGLGPMLYNQALTVALANVQTAIADVRANGERNISFVEFPPDGDPLPPNYGSEFGCDYHPDSTTQAALASILEAHIKSVMDW